MIYNPRDIIEYLVALVSDMAKRFGIAEKDVYSYIYNCDGVAFIEKNYGIIHTLSFEEALESLILYCRKAGGKL